MGRNHSDCISTNNGHTNESIILKPTNSVHPLTAARALAQPFCIPNALWRLSLKRKLLTDSNLGTNKPAGV